MPVYVTKLGTVFAIFTFHQNQHFLLIQADSKLLFLIKIGCFIHSLGMWGSAACMQSFLKVDLLWTSRCIIRLTECNHSSEVNTEGKWQWNHIELYYKLLYLSPHCRSHSICHYWRFNVSWSLHTNKTNPDPIRLSLAAYLGRCIISLLCGNSIVYVQLWWGWGDLCSCLHLSVKLCHFKRPMISVKQQLLLV